MTTFLSLWFLKKAWRSICFYNDNHFPICNNFDNLFMTIFTYCFYNFKYELTHCYIYTSVLVLAILGSFNIWLCLIILFITLKITLIEYKLSVTVFLLQKHHHHFSGEGGAGAGGNLVCWVFNCFFFFFLLNKLVKQLENDVIIILITNILTSDI